MSTADSTSQSFQSMKYHIIIWKICGWWDWPERPVWYRAYGLSISLFFFILFPLGMIIHLVTSTTDVFDAIHTMLFLFSALCGIKIWIVMRQKPLLRRIFDMMDTLDKEINTDEHRRTIATGVQRARTVNIVLCYTYYICVSLLYLDKLIENDGNLMWSFYVPFEYQHSKLVFHSVMFYQFVATMYSAIVHSSVDALGGSMYSVIGSHLDLLGKRLASLGVVASASDGQMVRKKNVFQNADRKAVEAARKQCERELSECVKTHLLCVE